MKEQEAQQSQRPESSEPAFQTNGRLTRSTIEGLVRGFRNMSFRQELAKSPERRWALYLCVAWVGVVAWRCWFRSEPGELFAVRVAMAPVGVMFVAASCFWLIWSEERLLREIGWFFLALFSLGIPVIATWLRP